MSNNLSAQSQASSKCLKGYKLFLSPLPLKKVLNACFVVKQLAFFFFLVTFRTIKSVFLTLKVANKSCQQRKFSESTLKEWKEKLGSVREALGERGRVRNFRNRFSSTTRLRFVLGLSRKAPSALNEFRVENLRILGKFLTRDVTRLSVA